MRDDGTSGLGGFMRLNDIAAAYGDGLIPELYDLMVRPPEPIEFGGNVVAFPERKGAPSKSPEPSLTVGAAPTSRR